MNRKYPILTTAFDDPETIEEAVAPFGGNVQFRPGKGRHLRGKAKIGLMPRLGIMAIDSEPVHVRKQDPHGCYGFTTTFGPEFEVPNRSGLGSFSRSTAHLLMPDEQLDLRAPQGLNFLVANFFIDDLRAHALRLSDGMEAFELPSDSRVSVTTPEGRSLMRYLTFAWGELNEGGGIFDSGLVTEEIEDTLIAALIWAVSASEFPTVDSSDARIRLAEEYLLAHLDQPISRAGLAETCGISIRSLSRAFNKRHGMGPMEFLRHRRLEAARRELLMATPEETTVTDVAMRYGFSHLSNFAAVYKTSFGESPGETLRS